MTQIPVKNEKKNYVILIHDIPNRSGPDSSLQLIFMPHVQSASAGSKMVRQLRQFHPLHPQSNFNHQLQEYSDNLLTIWLHGGTSCWRADSLLGWKVWAGRQPNWSHLWVGVFQGLLPLPLFFFPASSVVTWTEFAAWLPLGPSKAAPARFRLF